jgi:glucose-6-phosphate dehydrogenase assembly protein OpcA
VAAPLASSAWTGEGVRIADVAHKLRELRATEGESLHSTQTSVMNLVVYAPSAEAAVEIEQVTDALSDHHPSRAVIVIPAEGGDRIDARVEVMSHTDRPSGLNLQVEQIVLTLRGAVAAHAGSAVIPLLRSELPTFLWWPGAPDPASATFAELVRIADRLVTETGRELRGTAALERLGAVTGRSGAPVTDLAWAIITPWRQLVAMSLRGDALVSVRAASGAATITCRRGGTPLEALLFGGWLVDVLGEHLEVRFTEADGDEEILVVELSAGGERVLELTCEGGPGTVTLRTALGGPRSLPLPAPERRQLLAGELELRGRDQPFERAIVHAAKLAGDATDAPGR